MVGEDGGLPGGGVDVGVDLRGQDGLVPQHLLHDAEVGASAERVITLEYGKVTSENGGTEFGKAARKDVI